MGECCPLPRPPVLQSAPIHHQVINVALPRAEEVAVVVVRVAGIRAVVTVVTTSVIPVTSVQAASMAGNRDKVVNSRTSTPITNHSTLFYVNFLNITLEYLPGLELEAGKGAHVETMERTKTGNVLCKNILFICVYLL